MEPIIERNGNTTFYQRHKCISVAALLVSSIPEFNNQWFIYTGEDALLRLLEKLVEWERICINYLKTDRPMKPLSKEKQEKYNEATECCICHNKNKPFDPEQDDWRKVRDHDHVT